MDIGVHARQCEQGFCTAIWACTLQKAKASRQLHADLRNSQTKRYSEEIILLTCHCILLYMCALEILGCCSTARTLHLHGNIGPETHVWGDLNILFLAVNLKSV